MPGPIQWAAQLLGWGQRVTLAVTDVPVEMGKETRKKIAERNPKRTGRSAGSWNASIGSPNHTVQPPTYNDVSGSVDAGLVELDGYSLGQKIYISNGLDYVAALNNGSSRQAPAGFVEAATQEVRASLPEIVGRVRGKYRV